MIRCILALVALVCVSCADPPLRYELRVRPVDFSPLLLADLQGAVRTNLRAIGASLVLVDTQSAYDVELVFREADSECALFGSSVVGALRWQQWTALPTRVEVATNCTSRGFNQAMTHALLHAIDIGRGRATTGLPHVRDTQSLLRPPQYEEWTPSRGIEYVYGGSSLPENVTPEDVRHFDP